MGFFLSAFPDLSSDIFHHVLTKTVDINVEQAYERSLSRPKPICLNFSSLSINILFLILNFTSTSGSF